MLYDWKYPFNEKLGKLMKKNRIFIFIMALLMTLLLVVGCDVSPSFDSSIPEGCVNVRLEIADGRGLDVSSTVPDEITNWKYSLTPCWEYGDEAVSETPYGKRDMEELVDNCIGWVTPGLWKVEVYGMYIKDDHGIAAIYYGETEVYFNENNTTAVVYMKPYEYKEMATVNIEITQRSLSETNSEYYYCYTIEGVSGENAMKRSGVLTKDSSSGTYKAGESNLKADYYTINIAIYRNVKGLTDINAIKTGAELIGGETVGVFVKALSTVTVGGTVDPSDFVQGLIDVSSVNVKGSLNRGAFSKTNDGILTSFSVDDNSVISGNKTYTTTYQWYVNGVQQNETGISFSYTFNTYGPKEVSCVIVYTSGKEVYSATVKDTFTLTPSSV